MTFDKPSTLEGGVGFCLRPLALPDLCVVDRIETEPEVSARNEHLSQSGVCRERELYLTFDLSSDRRHVQV